MNNLILIGMMGSGKTSIGRTIGENLGWKHLDTDKMIEDMQGMTIREIFDRYGESHFRSLEAKLVEQLKTVESTVAEQLAAISAEILKDGLVRQ